MTAQAAVQSGNATTAGAENRGWFTGLFLPAGAGLRRAPVELKWSAVAAGWVRGWSDPAEQTSLALLVSDGALRFEFDDGSAAVLQTPGDYVLWAPGLRHNVYADAASTLVTVRWAADEQGVPQ